MHFWPMSVIRTSPLLPGDCAAEVDSLYAAEQMTYRAFSACAFVAARTKPVVQKNLVAMEGDGSMLPKLVYMKRPTQDEWGRLERAVIIEGPHGFLFMLEMLQ